MTTEGLRPIRCESCGKLICEADGTVAYRCPRCKRWSRSPRKSHLFRLSDPAKIAHESLDQSVTERRFQRGDR